MAFLLPRARCTPSAGVRVVIAGAIVVASAGCSGLVDGPSAGATRDDGGPSDATIDSAAVNGATGDGAAATTGVGDDAGDAGSDGALVVTSACVTTRACSAGCTDFSSTPILDGTATAFSPSSTSGGPCIVEPNDGALLPNNWARPRFRWSGGTPPFAITLHSNREAVDQVVYTSNSQWTMPAAIWQGLAASAWDDGSGTDTVTVTVADAAGASTVSFSIAPVRATGTITYAVAAGDANGWSWLAGFGTGDESSSVRLTPPTSPYASSATEVQWTLSRDVGGNLTTRNADTYTALPYAGAVQCIGCHATAPDATSVLMEDSYPWDGFASSLGPTNVGLPPSWLTPGGAETLSEGWSGMMTFSPAVWNAGHKIVVTTSQVPENATNPPWNAGASMATSNLVWIDLATPAAPSFVDADGGPLVSADAVQQDTAAFYANEGTTFGYLVRRGDPNPSASCPAWSHDGRTIVYASNDAAKDGRLDVGRSDLYLVPYDGGAGGTATPLEGAATTTYDEYYPSFSPDDRYVAFNVSPSNASMFSSANAEVYVVPATGATVPTRLRANDPATCTGVASPGVGNSWARWSPDHETCGGRTYYWLVFASTRLNVPFTVDTTKKNFKTNAPAGPTAQLYLTAFVDDGSGTPTTFPATYIWNQTTQTTDGYAESNYLPSWDPAAATP